MKLPFSFAKKKPEASHLFLSLLLYPDAVEASVWELDKKTGAHIVSAVTQELVHDTWQDRLDAADKCISTLEELAKTTRLEKVVLGLPPAYLSREGDILHDIRAPLKQITQSLGLVPIGFVSVYQAIIHKLKSEEGVPPSVILLGLSSQVVTLHLYRVGALVGEETVALQGGLAEHLEDALLRLNDGGILPSRILLYGTKRVELEAIKREVLKHPWTRGNQFLHFPKVEILPGDGAAVAVSYAGSAELAHDITEDAVVVEQEEPPSEMEFVESAVPIVPPLVSSKTPKAPVEDDEIEGEDEVVDDVLDNEDEEDEIEAEDVEDEDESVESDSIPENAESNSVLDKEKVTESDSDLDEEKVTEFASPKLQRGESDSDLKEEIDEEEPLTEAETKEHANVVAVDPSVIGFESETEESEEEEYAIEEEERKKHKRSDRKPTVAVASFFSGLKNTLKKRRATTPHAPSYDDIAGIEEESAKKPWLKFAIPIGGILFVLAIVLILFTIVLPKATVEVTVTPRMVTKSASIIVDPTLSTVSIESQKIPGIKKEDKQTADKTVPASGKKTVGDPAHGTVTLFNKSQTSKTIKSGTILSTGSFGFKVDDDVTIDAAIESLDQGTVTYGKQTVKVTAKDIGTDGNIAAGKSFTVAAISSDLVSGKNDSAFTGGTSQNITVVSKADQDAIVKALTAELTDKVKQAFSSGQDALVLIPETVKTQVDERVFSQEVGAQSKDVNGKVTVSIAGIAYKKDDVTALLSTFLNQAAPEGYGVDTGSISVSLSDPKVAKDGTIKVEASGSAQAVPSLPMSQLLGQIAGKSVTDAKALISKFPGVANVIIQVSSSLFPAKLPGQPTKIHISTKTAQ
jgi:hypothetical protein